MRSESYEISHPTGTPQGLSMIKASYLQKQGAKYRELARAEVSLEMRRQLFALASRCDELAAAMARWPGPKDLGAAPKKPAPVKAATPPETERIPSGTSSTLRFPDGPRARLVHGYAD